MSEPCKLIRLKLFFLREFLLIDINQVSEHKVQRVTHVKEDFSVPFHEYQIINWDGFTKLSFKGLNMTYSNRVVLGLELSVYARY